MQGLKIDTWYKGLLAVALAVFGVAAVAKLLAVAWISLGFAFFGLSAWAGETKQHALWSGDRYFNPGMFTRTYFRPTPAAALFAIIGTVLIGWGAFVEVRRELGHPPASEVVAPAQRDAQVRERSAAKGQSRR
jgi:hypothetical protein